MNKLLMLTTLLMVSLSSFATDINTQTITEIDRFAKLYNASQISEGELVVLVKAQIDVMVIDDMSLQNKKNQESIQKLNRWVDLLESEQISTQEFILLNKSLIDLQNLTNFSHGVER